MQIHVCPMHKEVRGSMLVLVLLLFTLVMTCLISNHDRDMRELECLQELNRMEYQHVYPVSD